jgi:hypothetical protein
MRCWGLVSTVKAAIVMAGGVKNPAVQMFGIV